MSGFDLGIPRGMFTVAVVKCEHHSEPCRARVLIENVEPGRTLVTYRNQAGILPPVLEPIKVAIPYLARCIKHKYPMRGTPLKAGYSLSPCDDACTHATGGECKCSCGGINHGTEL